MKEGDELVRLHVIQPVPARVLDEGELRVDTLADRGRGWLGEDEARHVLQLRAARAIRVPPEVGRLRGGGGHHPRALERALLRAIEGELRIDLLAEGGDGRLGRRRPPPAAPSVAGVGVAVASGSMRAAMPRGGRESETRLWKFVRYW